LIDELTPSRRKCGRPYTGGKDPLMHTRAPRELIENVKQLAARRSTAVSVIMREALVAYLSNSPEDEPAQREREAA
jgi:hypothetical protein